MATRVPQLKPRLISYLRRSFGNEARKIGRSWGEITDCQSKANRRDLEWVS